MARQFERPRYPGLQREDPFADGKNPFADPANNAPGNPETSKPSAAGNRDEKADAPPQAATPQTASLQTGTPQTDTPQTDTPQTDTPQTDIELPQENLFAAPSAPSVPGQPAYRSGDYVTTLPHRGRLILTLGLLGLVLVLLGGLGGLATYASGYGYQDAVLLSGLTPLAFLGLAASVPAALLGTADRRAMRAGAMDPAGRTRTNWGLGLALFSIVLSVTLVGLTVLAVVWQVMAEFGML